MSNVRVDLMVQQCGWEYRLFSQSPPLTPILSLKFIPRIFASQLQEGYEKFNHHGFPL